MSPTPFPRIGVIADTHNHWVPEIAQVFAGVDEIWHLGDVCEESILDELRAITTNLTVIIGNNDHLLSYPLTRQLKRGGERFHLIHIPPRRWPIETDWVLFGHTHVPVNQQEGKLHLFNPGSAGRANKGAPLSVGFLEKKDGAPYQARIVLL
jgi:putative phosphoesterase